MDQWLTICGRCLVYVEGDAAIKQYEDAEGNSRSALNIVQRTRSLPCNLKFLCADTLQEASRS